VEVQSTTELATWADALARQSGLAQATLLVCLEAQFSAGDLDVDLVWRGSDDSSPGPRTTLAELLNLLTRGNPAQIILVCDDRPHRDDFASVVRSVDLDLQIERSLSTWAKNHRGGTHVWLMWPQSPGDLPLATGPRQATLFPSAVAQGLTGLADVDQDRQLTLRELHEFVAQSVTQLTSAASAGQARQAPRLLQARPGRELSPPDLRLAAAVRILPVPRSGWEALATSDADPVAKQPRPAPATEPDPAAASRDLLSRALQQWERGTAGEPPDLSPDLRAPHLWKVFEHELLQASRSGIADGRLTPSQQAALAQFLVALESRSADPQEPVRSPLGRRLQRRLAARVAPVTTGPSLALLRPESTEPGQDLLLTLERHLAQETAAAFEGWWSRLSPEERMTQELLDVASLLDAGVDWPVLRRILAARLRESRLAVASCELGDSIHAELLAAQRARRNAEKLLLDNVRAEARSLALLDLGDSERHLEQAGHVIHTLQRARRSLASLGRRLPEWLALWSGCLAPGAREGPPQGDLREQLDLVRQLVAAVDHHDKSAVAKIEILLSRLDAIEARWTQFLPSTIAAQLEPGSRSWNHATRAALVASLLWNSPLPPPLAEELDRWRDAVDRSLREQLSQGLDQSAPETFVERTRLGELIQLRQALARLEAEVLKPVIPGDSALSRDAAEALRELLELSSEATSRPATPEGHPASLSALRVAHDRWGESQDALRQSLLDNRESALSSQQLRNLVWFLPIRPQELQDPLWDLLLAEAESRAWNDWLRTHADRLSDGLHPANTGDQPWLRLAERFRALGDATGQSGAPRPGGLDLRIRSSPATGPGQSGLEEAVVEVFNPLSFPVQAWLLIDHHPGLTSLLPATDPAVHTIDSLDQRALGWPLAERDRREAGWLSQVVPGDAWILGPGESRGVKLQWRSLATRPGESRFILRAVANSPGQPALATRVETLNVALPGDLPFDLELRSSPGGTRTSGDWIVAGYPNQPWTQTARLINRGSSRSLGVDVWSLRAPPDEPLPAQLLSGPSAAEWLNRQSRGPLLGRLQKLAVPAGGASGLLRFDPVPPASPVPSEKQAVDGQSPPVPTPGGLLFAIQDAETGETLLRHQQLEALDPASFVRPRLSHHPREQHLSVDLSWIGPGQALGPIPVECEVAVVDGPVPPRVYRTELGTDRPEVHLEVPIPPDSIARSISLSVAGYPRAFRYLLRPEQEPGEVPEDSAPFSIRVAQPPSGTALALPASALPVLVQVDAARGTLPAPGAFWEVGLDLDRNREFNAESTLRFRADRSVTAWFQGFTPEGGLRLETRVADFEISVPLLGLSSGRSLLLARLCSQDRETWSRPVEVLLDGVGPQVREVVAGPQGGTQIGEDLLVQVRADDGEFSGVARVEAILDTAGTGLFSTEPAPLVLTSPEPGRWVGKLPTTDQPEGPVTVLVRAIDRVGNVGPLARRVVDLKSPESIARQRAARRIEVRGKVLYFGTPVPQAALVLREVVPPPPAGGPAPNKSPPLEFEAVSDNQGAYRFPKVPPGKYTLQARGVFRNKLRETAVSVELDDQPDGRLQDLNLP
jgi:hypothetical protein